MAKTRKAKAGLGPLLAAAAALAWPVHTAGPAAAQGIPVIDAAANAQLVQQVAHALNTVRQLEAQYQQLRQTYEAIAHTNSVSGLAGRLGRVAEGVPGVGSAQVGGLLSGAGGLADAADILRSNRAFAPTGGDWTAAELSRRAQGLANVQAMAARAMRSSEERIAGLRELMAEIDGQPDLAASAALGNRIAAENALLSAQQQNLVQVQFLARSQEQTDALRAEERARESAERWRDSLRPLD